MVLVVNNTTEHTWKLLREEILNVLLKDKKTIIVCVVMDVLTNNLIVVITFESASFCGMFTNLDLSFILLNIRYAIILLLFKLFTNFSIHQWGSSTTVITVVF